MKCCMSLEELHIPNRIYGYMPSVIQKAVDSLENVEAVMDELKKIALEHEAKDDDMIIAMAVYMLGFGEYKRF